MRFTLIGNVRPESLLEVATRHMQAHPDDSVEIRATGSTRAFWTPADPWAVIQTVLAILAFVHTLVKKPSMTRQDLDLAVATALTREGVVNMSITNISGFENLLKRTPEPCVVSAEDADTKVSYIVFVYRNEEPCVVRLEATQQ